MSQEGQAESYNDLWWNTNKVKIIQQFLSQNPAVGRHFDKVLLEENDDEDEGDDRQGHGHRDRGALSGMQNMHRKSVSKV